jgi:hypothetical protein
MLAVAGCQSTNGPTGSSGCGKTAITLWDIDQDRAFGSQLISDQSEPQLLFSPDGTRLISNVDREVTTWSLAPSDWQQRACRIANRNMTLSEWKDYVGDFPYHKTCPDLPGA